MPPRDAETTTTTTAAVALATTAATAPSRSLSRRSLVDLAGIIGASEDAARVAKHVADAAPGVVEACVRALEERDADGDDAGVRAVEALALASENCAAIVRTPTLVDRIVRLMQAKQTDPSTMERALRAFISLSSAPETCAALFQTKDLLGVVVRNVEGGTTPGITCAALGVLQNLSSPAPHKTPMVQNQGLLKALVWALVSARGVDAKKRTVGLLSNLAVDANVPALRSVDGLVNALMRAAMQAESIAHRQTIGALLQRIAVPSTTPTPTPSKPATTTLSVPTPSPPPKPKTTTTTPAPLNQAMKNPSPPAANVDIASLLAMAKTPPTTARGLLGLKAIADAADENLVVLFTTPAVSYTHLTLPTTSRG